MPREMRVIRGVPIVNTGEWEASTGTWTVTPDDLRAAVAAVNDPAIRLPRVWIGHDPARDTPGNDAGTIAVGWLSNLRTASDDTVLLSDLHVPPLLADTMHAHFPGRSVEAWTDYRSATGIEHRLVIEGVALLGRELPAVETLEDIAELWGITPDRDPQPEGAPAIAASRRIVCALGRDLPASDAGTDHPRTEATMADNAPVDVPETPAPEAQAQAPEPTTPNPAPEAQAPAAPAEPAAPQADTPAIPDGFRLVEQGVWDDIQNRLAQVDDLVSERTAREANEFVGELVAAGRIAASSRDSFVAQYREDPARTRAICDLLPEHTHDAPPVGRIAAERGDDSNPAEEHGVSTRLLNPDQIQRLRDRGVITEENS